MKMTLMQLEIFVVIIVIQNKSATDHSFKKKNTYNNFCCSTPKNYHLIFSIFLRNSTGNSLF